MKQEHLFEAIGLVDDHLVEEAADARRTASPWKKWMATAACLVAVIGIGSLAAGTMLRGCGAKSEAPESTAGMNMTSDSAAAEPQEDAAADMDAPAESESGNTNDGAGGPFFSHYADPVLPLTASGGESLEVQRQVTFDVEADAAYAGITDSYQIENQTAQDQTVTLYYPVAADWNAFEEAALHIAVDGAAVPFETYGGGSLTGYSEDGLNLGWRTGWQELNAYLSDSSYLEAAQETVHLDQTVTVWRFTDVVYDEATAQSGASLAVWFEAPEDTTILTYGINGMGTDGDRTAYNYFVASPRQSAFHDLIFVGDAPDSYAVQGYADGGLEETQGDITGSIEVLTMTLEAYLRGIAGSDLEYQTLADLLTQTVLSDDPLLRYDPAMLETILQDNRAIQRVFYAAFEVTVPAGDTVEVTASYRKEASFNFYTDPDSNVDLYGFDLLTTLGSTLTFTEQTAALHLPDQEWSIENDEFGFADGVPVTLNLNEPHYALTLRVP